MFVASRVANTFKSVLPYAQWVTLLMSLGHAGYTAYNWYQEYLRQMELDARSGMHRTQEEIIELIIKPRRVRNRFAIDDIEVNQTRTSNGDNEFQQQQPSQMSSSQSMNIFTDMEPSTSTKDTTKIEASSNQDRSSNIDEPLTVIDDAEDDEVLSTASTSLESTDSNNGIVNDMYKECFICATSLTDPNKQIATLPFCLHPFHKSCLDGVLKWHQKCPICDYDIFSPI